MSWLRRSKNIFYALFILTNSFLNGADCSCSNFIDLTDELDERDFEAVTKYINSKRLLDLNQKLFNLKISGDVRFEWQHILEKVNGIPRRGSEAVDCTLPLPQNSESNAAATTSLNSPSAPRVGKNDFDVEFNLVVEYQSDRAWACAQIEFDNPCGSHENSKKCGQPEEIASGRVDPCNRFDNHACHGSGRSDRLSLRKAYIGYNLCLDPCSRIDLEFGRRRLYDVFDSKIQFLSLFDGLCARYSTRWGCSDYIGNLAAFVVDERANHFAWACEFSVLNVSNYNFDIKYSYIDWDKKGKNRCNVSHPRGWQFKNSQVTLAYHWDPDILSTPCKIYGAFLYNHAAKKRAVTMDKRENLAFYLGFIIGEVCGCGDWSVEANYQYVEAQAVSDCDLCGIGRGNVYDETFTMAIDPRDARGNANFKGFKIDALYAILDNFCINAQYQYSRANNKSIGGDANYSKLKIEGIYSF